MAILNVTPDSFSDGGQNLDCDDALLSALEMVNAGADIIDIGGESTRLGAKEVSPAEEAFRVLPVIETIRKISDIPISVDTRHASVARAALEAGADIINDVSALADPEMAPTVAEYEAGLVIMHGYAEHTTPSTSKLREPIAPDTVKEFLRKRIDYAKASKIKGESIVIDPGFGFGKTTADNIELLKSLQTFTTLDHPLLIALSRKRFIGEITHSPDPEERLGGSLSAMFWALTHGAAIVRVHDVRASKEAIDIAMSLA